MKKAAKDYTKYSFLGELYGKSNLVLAVVKKYVELHPHITAATLNHVFPKSKTECAFDVVCNVETASPKRFFVKEDDVIQTKDAKVAVTSQWTKDNIKSFIFFAKKNLNFKIHQHRVAIG